MPLQFVGEYPGQQQRHEAEAVGRSRADGDQRPHVEIAGHDGGPAALEERLRNPDDHWRRQHELQPAHGGAAEPVGPWQAHHSAHLERQNSERKRCPYPEPTAEVDELGVRTGIGRGHHRLERHAADRAVAWPLLNDLGIHRAGVERALGHRFGRGAVAEVVVGRGFEFLLAAAGAEVEPLARVLCNVASGCTFHAHSADRILVLDVSRWIGLELGAAAVVTEMIDVSAVLDGRLAGLGVYAHSADRVTGDCIRLLGGGCCCHVRSLQR